MAPVSVPSIRNVKIKYAVKYTIGIEIIPRYFLITLLYHANIVNDINKAFINELFCFMNKRCYTDDIKDDDNLSMQWLF